MTAFARILAATAVIGGVAAPVSAQYNPYPSQQGYDYPAYPGQPYPPQYPQQTYPPGYGYPQQQGYGQGYGQNPVGQIIDQLLGNRYNVTDRQAVARCARAAMSQAAAQYGGGYGAYGQQQYGQGYNRGYGAGLRVTAITEVQRRSYGLRVSGLLSSGRGYGGQYGYQNRGYAQGDLSFRCNVDYRGAVTGLRIRPANAYRG